MLVDGGQESFFRGCDYVVDSIAGGRRTSVVVVTPSHVDRAGQLTGEVDYVVICHGVEFVGGVHAVYTEEVGITAGAVCLIPGHVAECGMVCDASSNSLVET